MPTCILKCSITLIGQPTDYHWNMQIYGLVEETSALFVTSHPEFGNIHNQDPALNYLSVTYQPKSNVYPRQEMIWVPRTMPKGVTDNIAIQPAAGPDSSHRVLHPDNILGAIAMYLNSLERLNFKIIGINEVADKKRSVRVLTYTLQSRE
ncbi:uncharacterized protein LOC110855069 [Folsomia candida]|uniref:Uncharacterized protein n=1 Tax=Folsomia candida TaxID=158441 RepID=A0A226DVE3_FOLCA|nr:uncharacterized protein LOC110855069 [Folsomia candida]OXA48998.1 hypothetical protein Fcan01_16274 [Folsomia candida]